MTGSVSMELSRKTGLLLKNDSPFYGYPYLISRQKRFLDLLISTPNLTWALPTICLLGMLVIAHDHNIPFKNVGQINPVTQEQIPFWKISTMAKDADLDEEKFVGESKSLNEAKRNNVDTRVTPLGNILRKTSLNELPQLASVFFGDLSLIGPRPHTRTNMQIIIKNKKEFPYSEYLQIFNGKVKFGIIGLGQVFGRSDLSLLEQTRLDVEYLKLASFKADLRVIGLTISTILSLKD